MLEPTREPSRLVLFETGATLGVFPHPEGPSTIMLEPSGDCFTHVRQDGFCHRQLSDFCRRDLVSQVAAVVRFRNCHSPRPFLSQRLLLPLLQREVSKGLDEASNLLNDHHGNRNRNSTRSTSNCRRRRVSRLARWPSIPRGSCQSSSSSSSSTSNGDGEERWEGTAKNVNQRRRHHPRRNACGCRLCACTIVHPDGRVEVRAVGGNARLMLSESRALVDVDYLVSVPGTAPTTAYAARGNERGAEEPGNAEQADAAATGRGDPAWVTRQFLAQSSSVPPEFSHALDVALRLSSTTTVGGATQRVQNGRSSKGVQEGRAWGAGDRPVRSSEAVGGSIEGVCGHVKEGLVGVELPLPQGRPDHASWDTIQEPPRFDSCELFSGGALSGGLSGDRRYGSTAPIAAATTSSGLLTVDISQLARGRTFAGFLASVVEWVDGCCYRVVIGGAGRSEEGDTFLEKADDDGGGVVGDGGCGGQQERLNVHVVVDADGTEVVLEGDFVRLVRPLPPDTSSRRPEEHLLHVSAASTVTFSVPSAAGAESRLGSRESKPVTVGALATDVTVNGREGSNGDPSRASRSTSRITPSNDDAKAGCTTMSLGDITSRALALRRQFVMCSAALPPDVINRSCDAGPSMKGTPENLVRIRPPTLESSATGCGSTLTSRTTALDAAGRQLSERRRTKHDRCPTEQEEPVARRQPPGSEAPFHIRLPINARHPPELSTTVVERVERGGASFVAFADGRARGIFADRTIVTLAVPIKPRAGMSFDVNEGVQGDQEIDCVLPDGLPLRLPMRSMFLGMGHGNTVCGGHQSRAYMRRRFKAGSIADLRPYVTAVRRFSKWAFSSLEQRQDAVEREAVHRLFTLTETERNRRFVTLQRLVANRTSPATGERDGDDPCHARDGGAKFTSAAAVVSCSEGSSTGSSACSSRGAHVRGGNGRKAHDDRDQEDKENSVVGVSSSGLGLKPREFHDPPEGLRERNALVMRVLEANRALLMS